MAAAFAEALGQEVRNNCVSPEVYRGLGFPGANDLGNMFQCKRDFEEYFCGARNLAFSRSPHPSLQGFKTWLARNKTSIRIAPGAASAERFSNLMKQIFFGNERCASRLQWPAKAKQASTAKSAAEKCGFGPSGVKTPEENADIMSCLKARPTKRKSFSAAFRADL
jgi:hypothetical protein